MDSYHAVFATLTKSICSISNSLSYKIETVFFAVSNFFFQNLLRFRGRQFDSPAKSVWLKLIEKFELDRVCPEVVLPTGATFNM